MEWQMIVTILEDGCTQAIALGFGCGDPMTYIAETLYKTLEDCKTAGELLKPSPFECVAVEKP